MPLKVSISELSASLASPTSTLLYVNESVPAKLSTGRHFVVHPADICDDDLLDFLIDELRIPEKGVGILQNGAARWLAPGESPPSPMSPKAVADKSVNQKPPSHSSCLRLFVSGSRSQVGKSSVCVGILHSLLSLGYAPSEISYIKPATQCEEPQPVQTFCERVGIDNRPIGPIVYYKGFTRSFLAGETDSSETLLQSAKKAVDEMCGPQKKFCLIDGVGYPAVGSITGTSNGEVASACGASVLLVGGKGVGDAVDTFNLNATYFSSRSVPVIGAIFNRLPSSGYYSLENCKNAVTSYFEQYGEGRSVFGFVPECQDGKKEFDMESFLESFVRNVHVPKMIEKLLVDIESRSDTALENPLLPPPPQSQLIPEKQTRTRAEIETEASLLGASGG